MGIIAHTYDAGQLIWVITTSAVPAVRGGKVIQVRATALTTGTTVAYDVRLDDDSGTTTILEVNMFATLVAAVDEYEVRLT